MSESQLRVGDTEREQAAAALGEHFAQGRLSVDEHDERIDRVWSARTRADLGRVFRDLPGAPRRTPPPGYWNGRRGFPGPLLLVLGVLGVLTALTHVPLILLGLLAVVFVASRRRSRSGGCGRPPALS